MFQDSANECGIENRKGGQEIVSRWRSWFEGLVADGRAVAGSPLEREGKVVSGKSGRVVADGSPDELRAQTGQDNLEDAFVDVIGSEEGLS